MVTVPSTTKRLHWFIDAILMEERKFRLWSHQLHLDFSDIEKMHAEGICRPNGCARHADIRQTHVEIFRKHQKIREEHNNTRAYCQTLLERLNSGHYRGADMIRELEKLSSFYEALRADHNLMADERRQVLAEHQALMAPDSGSRSV
jgi:hypothetical protein